ncbi:hypothetical protein HF929_11885 [Acidithiobacillus ferrivorans]|uniref:Uncharacterized protein n=2 Tax=Acidithiobacillus ferrivorans TaxID=160808 RepID=A0A7T5BJC8_9PROT|nr:hypothetical protein [Acidithiobacillus ferrivorans]QQD74238.1 hypothetical protein H2515_07810 [Acidithiobacillus ferrivorans]
MYHTTSISPFNVIEAAGTAVLTLTEGLEKEEFLASRLTRAETRRQLRLMSAAALLLSAEIHALMVEIDWDGWRTLDQRLATSDQAADILLWLAVCALAPDTLMWLRVYRKNQPEWFKEDAMKADVCYPAISPGTGACP